MESTTKRSRSGRILLIALAITVLLSLANWAVVTDWGDINIETIRIAGSDGEVFNGIMYIPSAATDANPAPAILTIHGNSGSARNHEVYAVEYARRGFVVLAIDNTGGAETTYSATAADFSRTRGPKIFWDFLVSCPFVDTERTVVQGHSVGSTSALHVAAWANPAPTVCVPVDGFMGVYPSQDELYYTGMICAITGAADNQNPDEMLQPLLGLFALDERVTTGDTLEYDKLYGSFEDGSAKGVFVTNSGHEDAMINRQGMQIQLDFVQNAMEVPNPIDGSNQIWMWKDIFGLFLMLSFVFTLIALYMFMVEDCKLFQSIRQPLPRNIGLRKVGLTISIVAAIVIPVLVTWTGSFGLTTLLRAKTQKLFIVSNSTLTMSLIIGFTIIGAITLVLFIFTDGKKKHATLRDYGLTSEGKTGIDWVLIGKSLLLALIVTAAGFSYLRVQRELLGTDIYAWYYGFKPIAWNKIGLYIPYVLVWIVCFIFSALALNVERRLPSTGSETKDMVIACVFNVVLATIAITVIVFVQQYLQHYVTKLSSAAMKSWVGDITHSCWGLPVGLSIGAFGNTYMYRKTGSIWPGAFLMAILCSMSCVLFGHNSFTV